MIHEQLCTADKIPDSNHNCLSIECMKIKTTGECQCHQEYSSFGLPQLARVHGLYSFQLVAETYMVDI